MNFKYLHILCGCKKNLNYPTKLSVPLQIPNVPYAIQHPKLYIQKYCCYHSQCQCYLTLTSALLKILPKSIIGTIPNTNNNLRCPAPLPKSIQKESSVTFPNTSDNLRYPASIFKIYPKSIIGNIPKCQ